MPLMYVYPGKHLTRNIADAMWAFPEAFISLIEMGWMKGSAFVAWLSTSSSSRWALSIQLCSSSIDMLCMSSSTLLDLPSAHWKCKFCASAIPCWNILGIEDQLVQGSFCMGSGEPEQQCQQTHLPWHLQDSWAGNHASLAHSEGIQVCRPVSLQCSGCWVWPSRLKPPSAGSHMPTSNCAVNCQTSADCPSCYTSTVECGHQWLRPCLHFTPAPAYPLSCTPTPLANVHNDATHVFKLISVNHQASKSCSGNFIPWAEEVADFLGPGNTVTSVLQDKEIRCNSDCNIPTLGSKNHTTAKIVCPLPWEEMVNR